MHICVHVHVCVCMGVHVCAGACMCMLWISWKERDENVGSGLEGPGEKAEPFQIPGGSGVELLPGQFCFLGLDWPARLWACPCLSTFQNRITFVI